MAHQNGTTNGRHVSDPGPIPAQSLSVEESRRRIKELRVANKLNQEVLESKRIEYTANLLEALGGFYQNSYPGDGGGSDESWLKLRSQYGDGWIPLATPGDRRGGAKWPIWRNEIDLNRIRQASRVACATNSYAKSLQKNLTNYVIGKGFTYKVTPDKDKAKRLGVEQGTVDQYVTAIQTVIDEFLELNRWNTGTEALDINFGVEAEDYTDTGAASSREREIYRRVNRDGECFVRLFYKEDGRTEIRFVDPELVSGGPPGGTWQNGWSFGIKWVTQPAVDLEKRLAFFVKHHDTSADSAEVKEHLNGVTVPASEMVQIMAEEEDAEVMRGTPLFSFSTLNALNRAESLQEAVSITSRVRAATAEIWQHAYGTRQEIASMSTGLANGLLAGSTGPEGTYGYANTGKTPGQTRRVPAGQEMKQPPDGTGMSEFMSVAKGDLAQASSAFAAPPYMTGSDEGSSYAQASEAGTPFVRNGESEQEHYKGQFKKVMERVVWHAARCRRIPHDAARVVKLQIEAMQIHKNDDAAMAQKNMILNQARVLSPQTWQMKEGLDSGQEMMNWKEWDQQMGQPGGEQQPGAEQGAPGAEQQMPPGQEQADGGQPGGDMGGMGAEGQPGAEPGAEQGGAPGGQPSQEDMGDDQERLDAMADILGGAYGEDALKMLQKPGEGQE